MTWATGGSPERCVCGARSTYRLTRGGRDFYRCACCASNYAHDEAQSELLPWAQRNQAEDIYQHYRELRDGLPYLAPELLGTLPAFAAFEQLEDRYQREGQRARRTA